MLGRFSGHARFMRNLSESACFFWGLSIKWNWRIKRSFNVDKKKVIVICGPTASGKTAMGIELAKEHDGEVVSADSMQIYKDMNIGTAKPTEEEMEGIPHHLIDFVSPDERYSVADYKRDAKNTIRDIISRGKTPIVVGGTGLYVDSLVYEIDYPNIEFDEKYRTELEELTEKEGLENLYEKAKQIDPIAMEKISSNDKKRILRVLEIYHSTGKTKTELEKVSRKEPEFDYKVHVIDLDRNVLYDRINTRVERLIEQGLVQEVEHIVAKYESFPTALQALGYKEVVEYLQGELTYDEMVDKIKQETRRYAKRQITWFKKYIN